MKYWTDLKDLVANIVQDAKHLGADSAAVWVSDESGLSATVRLGAVETIEFNHDKLLAITIYKGKKKGSVSTTDFQKGSIRTALEAACRIAEYTEEDECAGLADLDCMAKEVPDLNLYHPWQISAEQAVLFARECEESARGFDARIVNSEGASFSTHTHFRVYGNTHGFIGAYPSTRHSLSCGVIAKSKEAMQSDYDFTTARDGHDLVPGPLVGRRAAERTVRRLEARKINTCQVPVIFAAEIAGSIWGHLISAILGGNLYRNSSFLVDHLGKVIFPKFVNVEEVPHLLKGLGSAPFDQEGVATTRHPIIQDGVLKSYVLSSYSARKLGLKTTGNAGGTHNLMISHGEDDLAGLLKKMGKGLLVTTVLGHGINIVTGDYSRGAAGFWVENGEIQYPVEEITIAGNLKEMFSNLVAIGNDIEKRTSIFTGSLWIERMTIAGS